MITLSYPAFSEDLAAAFAANGLSALLTSEITERFYTLTECLLSENETMNLTAITDPRDVIVKHYADCALAVHLIPRGTSLADVGTGAGFPALPFAILRPDITVTAIDSTQKKLDYVARTASALSLSNLTTLSARAEELGKDHAYREQFDIATARAVARLNVLCEWCMPLIKKGGYFLALKGKSAKEEFSEASHAIDVLGGVAKELLPLTLSDPFSEHTAEKDSMQRGLIFIYKRQYTPGQYPRANSQISKKPL